MRIPSVGIYLVLERNNVSISPLWRNWIARSTSNREVASSSLARGVVLVQKLSFLNFIVHYRLGVEVSTP